MKKTVHFADWRGDGWPSVEELEPYFMAPPGQRGFLERRGAALLQVVGVDGSDDLEQGEGRIDVDLDIWGHPDLGVLLIYSKWGGGHRGNYSSKGDLRRVREWVRSNYNDPLPIGLFIPYESAWKAARRLSASAEAQGCRASYATRANRSAIRRSDALAVERASLAGLAALTRRAKLRGVCALSPGVG